MKAMNKATSKHRLRRNLEESAQSNPNIIIDTEQKRRQFEVRVPKSIGALLPDVLQSAIGKRGIKYMQLLIYWPEIIGTELARKLKPIRVVSKRSVSVSGAQQKIVSDGLSTGSKRILVLATSQHQLLYMQYEIPSIISRVNTWSGNEWIHGVKLQIYTQLPEAKRKQG